tara:strand:- start:83 stop:325 length:243 start_codon:yes stop_codon:yes gene_type:complete
MKPIIIGAINLPSNSPNFIQIFLNGLNKLELKIPRIRNSKDMRMKIILKVSLFARGQIPIKRKIIKKTMPKLLFDAIFFI